MAYSACQNSYEHIVLNQYVDVPTYLQARIHEQIDRNRCGLVKSYGWSPEEIHFQHPYLSLGQIYSALAYYWDNSDEINRDIIERKRRLMTFVDKPALLKLKQNSPKKV